MIIKPACAALCLASCIALAWPAAAQTIPKRKPGLWESQMTTSAPGVPNMQEQLAGLPPEQRAQMEAMMKQRGMSFGPQGSTTTVRFCMSEKDAADESGRSLASRSDRDASKCEDKVVSRTAAEVRIHTVCRSDRGPSEYDVRVYEITPVSMAMEVNGRSAEQGEIRMQQKARWVASDCGATR